MPHADLSSGDMIADRRADYAKMLFEGGEPLAAAELLEQALSLVPQWTAGWYQLGTYREKADQHDGAVAAYRQCMALDKTDIFGAGLKLAVLGDQAMPDQPPSSYVERLFDDYAARFETALVEKLDYTVPQQLAALIATTQQQFACAVDLGCGTGLLGPEIRAFVSRLEGYDLSRNMLAKAADKHIYDHLAQSDLTLSVDESGLFAEGFSYHRADLVASADVLMYLGSLRSTFAIVDALTAPRAISAFSVEEADAGNSFVLQQSLRYAHSEPYLRALCADYGFDVLEVKRCVLRQDAGRPVPGLLVLAQKQVK